MSEESCNDVCRLRIEFENNEIDWEYPLDLNGRIIKSIFVNDERIRECYACSKLAELMGENNALHVKVVDLAAERDQWREAAGNAHEMWEQSDNERIKLAEQLRADVSQAVEDTAERVTNQGEMLHDTREKLEADVRANCYHEAMPAGGRCWMLNDGIFESVVIGWLDRQAAITEREREQHWLEIVGASANCNLELTNQIAELTEQLEASRRALEILTLDKAKLQTKINKLEGGGDD